LLENLDYEKENIPCDRETTTTALSPKVYFRPAYFLAGSSPGWAEMMRMIQNLQYQIGNAKKMTTKRSDEEIHKIVIRVKKLYPRKTQQNG
jgi:hypothetical protein